MQGLGARTQIRRRVRSLELNQMLSRSIALFLVALLVGSEAGKAQTPASDFSTMLRWRNIGPFRGGRVRAIAGVPSQPNVFYFAQVNGGVFKTTDYGRTRSEERRVGKEGRSRGAADH